jgi:DNA-binding CsgD family transcriptional regulator
VKCSDVPQRIRVFGFHGPEETSPRAHGEHRDGRRPDVQECGHFCVRQPLDFAVPQGDFPPFRERFERPGERIQPVDPRDLIAPIRDFGYGLEIVARADPTTRLALFYDRIGRTSEARALRNRILEESAQRGEQYETSYLLMHAGAMAAQRGDIEEALEMSKASLRLKRTLVNPIGVAHIEEVLASVAARQGKYDRVATLLGAAASEREQVGAVQSRFPSFVPDIGAVREKARSALGSDSFNRAFDRGVVRSHDEGIAWALDDLSSSQPSKAVEQRKDVPRLTPREREVAALVARGLSDREIASELVVARRTAEGHVQRILVKLGLTSRTQLAAWYLTARESADDA